MVGLFPHAFVKEDIWEVFHSVKIMTCEIPVDVTVVKNVQYRNVLNNLKSWC